MKTTFICMMNQTGKRLKEINVVTDPKTISEAIRAMGFPVEKVALEWEV